MPVGRLKSLVHNKLTTVEKATVFCTSLLYEMRPTVYHVTAQPNIKLKNMKTYMSVCTQKMGTMFCVNLTVY